MPPPEVGLGEPTGLGHGRIEYTPVTKGMDHVAQGVATAVPLGDTVIHFGIGHSCSWKK